MTRVKFQATPVKNSYLGKVEMYMPQVLTSGQILF